MDIQRVKYFLTLADSPTVTAAASKLGITQPALSRQLRRFEKEVGLELLERGTGATGSPATSLRLNDTARSLLPACRRLYAENRSTERATEVLRQGVVERLIIAATQTTISTIVAPLIATAQEGIPVVTTQPIEHYAAFNALEGNADAVVSPLPPRDDLCFHALGQAPIRAWVPPSCALAGRDNVDIAQLSQHRLALPSHRSVSRTLFDAFLGTASAPFGEMIECDDTATLLALAKAEKALAICTAIAEANLVPLKITAGDESLQGVPLYLVWNPGHFASAQLEKLGDALQNYIAAATTA